MKNVSHYKHSEKYRGGLVKRDSETTKGKGFARPEEEQV